MKGCFQQNGSEALTLGKKFEFVPGFCKFYWQLCRRYTRIFVEKFLCVLFIWKLTWRLTVVRLSRVVWHWSWKGRMCLEKWHWSYAAAVAYRSVSGSTWVSGGAKMVGFIYILYETLCRAAVPVRFMFTRWLSTQCVSDGVAEHV